MDDINKNIRTLVLCFAIAMAALVPLRFVELGNFVSETQVLGVVVENDEEVVLPNSDLGQEVSPVPEVHQSTLIVR